MTGYFADLKESAAVLQDGWLSTGDLGYLCEGLLYITGRAKEMIIVNGKKFYPQDVELPVSQVEGVYKGRCVAFSTTDTGQQMTIAVETDLDSELERAALIRKLRSLISNHLGLLALQIYLLQPGSIPRTSSGKQQRLLLRHQLQSAQLQAKLWPEYCSSNQELCAS
jgi:acyl-CoA synthetase (AMP-forming)/AMP-acid ligase II